MLLMKAVVLSALLTQGALDQRSPFGTNAPDNNDVTPQRVPVNRPDDKSASSLPAGTGAADPAASTDQGGSAQTPAPASSTPPASLPSDTDTGGSSAAGGTGSTTRSARTPPIIRPDQSVSPTPGSVTPGTQRSTSTPVRGANGVTGTTAPGSTMVPTPATASPVPPAGAPPPTYPGVSSGASNTQ